MPRRRVGNRPSSSSVRSKLLQYTRDLFLLGILRLFRDMRPWVESAGLDGSAGLHSPAVCPSVRRALFFDHTRAKGGCQLTRQKKLLLPGAASQTLLALSAGGGDFPAAPAADRPGARHPSKPPPDSVRWWENRGDEIGGRRQEERTEYPDSNAR